MNIEWRVRELSPLALAFVGDAVWEVVARNHVLNRGVRKPRELQEETAVYVQAKTQAFLADKLQGELTEEERDVLRRGRNAKAAHSRRNAGVLEYRHSTGFEAVIGYLYGTGQTERLAALCKLALGVVDQERCGDVAGNEQGT